MAALVTTPSRPGVVSTSVPLSISQSHNLPLYSKVKSSHNNNTKPTQSSSIPTSRSSEKVTMTTAAVMTTPSSASKRPQGSRQPRANPTPRRSNNPQQSKPAVHSPESITRHQPDVGSNANIRFYPGLAAFTDTIDALPQETIRHFTLLREVDAKACGPEQQLRRYIQDALVLPETAPFSRHDIALEYLRGGYDANVHDGVDPTESQATRRSRLHQVRMTISDLLLTLDEKIHVISTASEALTKHLMRVDDAYATVATEIDSTIRDGNPEHWAYKMPQTRGTQAQRQAQQVADSAAAEAIAARSESRREAMASRKTARDYPHENDDSQADAPGPSNFTSKRSHGASRARKEQEFHHGNTVGATQTIPPSPALGLPTPGSAQAPPAKKRKTVVAALSAPINSSAPFHNAKAIETLNESNIGLANATGGNSSTGPKKQNSGTPADHPSGAVRTTSGNVRRRHIVASLPPTSSPVQSTFKVGDVVGAGPHPLITSTSTGQQGTAVGSGKPPPSRPGRSRPQSAAKGGSPSTITSESLEAAVDTSDTRQQDQLMADSGPRQRATSPVKQTVAATPAYRSHSKKASISEDVPRTAVNVRENIYKKEYNTSPRLVPQTTHTASAKAAYNGSRTTQLKGEGTIADDEADDEDEEADQDDEADEADEAKYCYCNQVSYGKMVACDGPNCQKEWFHLPCVNLTHMPGPREKWYCNECKAPETKPRSSHQHRA